MELFLPTRIKACLLFAYFIHHYNVLAWSTGSGKGFSTRRTFVGKAAKTVGIVSAVFQCPTLATADTTQDLLKELQECKARLEPIPALLEEKEWDKVRTILKLPPVNKLWNLGDSKNTVLALAKETGDVDLFEKKDDLAYNLQMTDQLTYDNAFVYFQPGSGKLNIKDPQRTAKTAMKQIQDIIDAQQ